MAHNEHRHVTEYHPHAKVQATPRVVFRVTYEYTGRSYSVPSGATHVVCGVFWKARFVFDSLRILA